jgi:hypothetical protein
VRSKTPDRRLVRFLKVIVSCLDRGQRYADDFYVQPTDLPQGSVGRFHGYIRAPNGTNWMARIEESAAVVPEEPFVPGPLGPTGNSVQSNRFSPPRRAVPFSRPLPTSLSWRRERVTRGAVSRSAES